MKINVKSAAQGKAFVNEVNDLVAEAMAVHAHTDDFTSASTT